jgi:uncharacterized protein (DUF1499 family)
MAKPLGVRDGRLADCPFNPNCVCSDASDPGHRIAPFALATGPEQAWRAIEEVVASLPRTRVVVRQPEYLHAEARSLLGFVDDLELHLRADEGLVAVRSASRLGYSDLGVNRKRIEALRGRLQQRGVLR